MHFRSPDKCNFSFRIGRNCGSAFVLPLPSLATTIEPCTATYGDQPTRRVHSRKRRLQIYLFSSRFPAYDMMSMKGQGRPADLSDGAHRLLVRFFFLCGSVFHGTAGARIDPFRVSDQARKATDGRFTSGTVVLDDTARGAHMRSCRKCRPPYC